MVKVVAILGSPRRKGNSDYMLEVFLGTPTAQSHVETIIPSEMNLQFCRGCRFCEKTGYCILQDDMKNALEKLLSADQIVLSTPVFFYGVPAPLKAFIDRTQVLWARRYLLKEEFPPKEGFLLAVGATQGERLFEGVLLTVRYFFDAFRCTLKGHLFMRGFDLQGSIRECQACLTEIRKAGELFLSRREPSEPS